MNESAGTIAYRVVSCSPAELLACLAAASLAEPHDVERKLHLRYFTDYFAELAARTIVVEPGYVDHDYLEDYAAYYVRCFETYRRTTTRLHFFCHDFSATEFRSALTDADSPLTAAALQGAYLGFVVVKPLPQTIIGRTCLVTYPNDDGRRVFPILRDYEVNLLGIPLTVKSLAYQEQDTVVAACATSSLWSCFQGTGKLFQHAIPSPVEITKAATRHVPEDLPANNARALPRIDRIYAHDDQVGPFSRMIHARSTREYLATSWTGAGTVEARPWFLLAPLYHKIRIPFELIHDAILELDFFLEQARPHGFSTLPRAEWDIFLTTVNQLKTDIFCTLRPLLGVAIENALSANLPRFVWRVTAWCGDDRHLELLFDATGIAQHDLLVHVIAVRPELPALIAALVPHVAGQVMNRQTRNIFAAFSRNP